MFKFEPILKSIIWGGEKIVPYKHLDSDQKSVGESWELSGVKGDESVIANGEYAGKTLPELISILKGDLVGNKVYEKHGTEFPLLVKFIDARQDLSIQVHPNDELSRKRHGKNGKTEMWYVVGADEGAHLLSGFSKQVTPEEYAAKVADNTVTEVLTNYNVKAGDVFFLPAGRVHAIGAGSFVAEIQQTSDVTYRIYDYGRVGKDGKPRELHVELAKDAIDFSVEADYRTHYHEEKNKEVELVSCNYFTTSLFDLTEETSKDVSSLDSFLIVMGLAGEGKLIDDKGEEISIRQGETVLLPATTLNVKFIPNGTLKVLTSHL